MVSYPKRHQKIYVTNQVIDNLYVLSGILNEKRFFSVILSITAKSRAIDQLTLGNRPVDRDGLVGQP